VVATTATRAQDLDRDLEHDLDRVLEHRRRRLP
jgi:hypothetical protein